MDDPTEAGQELRDFERVEEALGFLSRRDNAKAREILLDVAGRTPQPYVREYDDGEALNIKFWSRNEFVHFATTRGEELKRNIAWKCCAYPRAFFYLGFLSLAEGKLEDALDFLARGERLEPNPTFRLERAQVYLRGFKDTARALECLDSILAEGLSVDPGTRAAALRAKGAVKIEQNELEVAETFYKSSLELEPRNPNALNELQYIAHLLKGGRPVDARLMESDEKEQRCSSCGRPVRGGAGFIIDGRAVPLCEPCSSGKTKKWWQFWK